VLIVAVGAAAVSALIFGLVPAIRYTGLDVLAALRRGGRTATDHPARHRGRHLLVVAQTAMALVLLVGSGLLARSFSKLMVMRSVVASGTAIAALGLVVGLLGAIGLTRFLGSLLYETAPLDLTTFIAMPALLLVVALLASYLPARKAASVSPLEGRRCGQSRPSTRRAISVSGHLTGRRLARNREHCTNKKEDHACYRERPRERLWHFRPGHADCNGVIGHELVTEEKHDSPCTRPCHCSHVAIRPSRNSRACHCFRVLFVSGRSPIASANRVQLGAERPDAVPAGLYAAGTSVAS
jgi:hypothetical protein